MGEFYFSINVRSSDADGVAALLPDFAPQSILPGWVTAAVPQFDAPDAQKAAKRLSKALPQSVLTRTYPSRRYALTPPPNVSTSTNSASK